MWERFSFYTMLAMFTLYLRDTTGQGFAWSADRATGLYANYLMFVYASPLIGGWIADRGLGYRRAVMIGGLFFMAGHLLLSIPSEADRLPGAHLPRRGQRVLQAERVRDGRQPLPRGQSSQGPRVQHLLHGHQRRRVPGTRDRRVREEPVRLPPRVRRGRGRHGDLGVHPVAVQKHLLGATRRRPRSWRMRSRCPSTPCPRRSASAR
jgi:hypothetical protein